MLENKEKKVCERDNLIVVETGNEVELNQLYEMVIGFSWKTEKEYKLPDCIKAGMTVSEIQNAIRNMSKEERDERAKFVDETPEPVLVLLNKDGKCESVDNFIFYGNLNTPLGIVYPEGDNDENCLDDLTKNLIDIQNFEGDKECIGIDLLRLSKEVSSIVVYITSRDEEKTFKTIHDVSITIYNPDTMEAIYKYNLPDDNSDNRSQKMIELTLTDVIKGSWLMKVIGEGSKKHIQEIANKHICH